MEQNGRYGRICRLMQSVGLLIERRTTMAPGGRTGGPVVDVDIVCYCRVGALGGPCRGGAWDLPLLYNISSGQCIVGHDVAVIGIAFRVLATQSTEKKMTNRPASLPDKALQSTDNPLRGLSVAECGRQAP